MDVKLEHKCTTKAGLDAAVVHCGFTDNPFAGIPFMDVPLQSNWRCGYVRVPRGHPCDGKVYGDHIPELASMREAAMSGPPGQRGVIPMLCAVFDKDNKATMDAILDVHGSVTFGDKYSMLGDGWWIGFDCNHAGDEYNPKSLDFCIEQCESLAEQLAAIKTGASK